jgi:DNA repair ATPase RecN
MTNEIRCTKCEQKKSPEAFQKEKRKLNGLTSWCKECKNELRRNNHRRDYEYVFDRSTDGIPKGETHHSAKLTANDVQNILELNEQKQDALNKVKEEQKRIIQKAKADAQALMQRHDSIYSAKALARKFEVMPSTIKNIWSGWTWRSI